MTAVSMPFANRPTLQLASWTVVAVLAGAGFAIAPALGAGVVMLAALWTLPYPIAVIAVIALGSIQFASVRVAGLTIPIAAPAAIVLAARALVSPGRRRISGVDIALAGWLALLTASSLMRSDDVSGSLHVVGLLSSGVAAYGAVTLGPMGAADIRAILRGWLGLVAAGATVGIAAVGAHVVAGTTWGVTILEQPKGYPAPVGLSFEHNLFGSSCGIGAVVFLGLWRVRSPLLTRRWSRAGFWLCTAALVLSLTRGAWIGAAVGAVLVIMLTRGDTDRRLSHVVWESSVALAAVIAIVVALGYGSVATRLATEAGASVSEQGGRVLEFSKSTGYLRTAEWRTAITDAGLDPLFGLGADTYGSRHTEMTLHGPIPSYLGNWLVRSFHDGGLIGMVLLAGSFLAIAWPGRAIRWAVGLWAPLARVLCAGAITLLVAYLATDAFLFVWPWAFLGLVRVARTHALGEARHSLQHAS